MVLVYEADTLRDILFAGWALTGRLSKSGTAKIKQPIHFFAHQQNLDKPETRGVEVVKETSLVTKIENEFYTREEDRFTITVRFKLISTRKEDWDQSEADVEDIETEIERLLKTTFDPQTGVGVFWKSDFVWRNEDDINQNKDRQVILRTLSFSLVRLISRDTSVFDSFQRGALFDLSASSNLNAPPGADYNYTEVYAIEEFEGFHSKEVQVQAHPDGKGVPLIYAGGFGGTLIMRSYMKAADLGSTVDKINQIYKRQSNGEYAEVAILSTYTNNASQTLTKTRIVNIIEIQDPQPSTEGNGLLVWNMIAKIIKPSVWSVA